jgi:hypothetical protein
MKYAFIKRTDKNILNSGLSHHAIKMYGYMTRMLVNEGMDVMDELDMYLSLAEPIDMRVDEALLKNTIDELLRNGWIIEIN